MGKNNLKFFGVFFAIMVLVLSMYFVLAAIDQAKDIIIYNNVTAFYDEGNFTFN